MAKQKKRNEQPIENIDENLEMATNRPQIQAFFSRASCVVCGAEFDRPARSKSSTCSQSCSRERRLRYGASYRQNLRDMKRDLMARFGGRMPTADELLTLFWRSRGHDEPPDDILRLPAQTEQSVD